MRGSEGTIVLPQQSVAGIKMGVAAHTVGGSRSPPLKGRGGASNILRVNDIQTPPLTPPLEGRGAAAERGQRDAGGRCGNATTYGTEGQGHRR